MGAVVEKVPAYKHAHLWQIQKYSHGKVRKSLPSMGKYLNGGGRGESCSVKRTTDKSAKPNTCNRWLGQQTRAVYFATLLRNEMESDVVRFTTRVAINLVTGCEKLLEKAENSTFFARKSVHFAIFTSPRLVSKQVTKRPYMA